MYNEIATGHAARDIPAPRIPHPIVDAWEAVPERTVFADPDSALQWLCKIDLTRLIGALSWLNGTVRCLPPESHGLSRSGTMLAGSYVDESGNSKEAVAYIAPFPEVREMLLGSLHRAARHMQNPQTVAEMFTVTLAEGQFFVGANKRTARYVYQLGVRGYGGSPQEQLEYSAAIYNLREEANIDFGGINDCLSSTYAAAVAEDHLQSFGLSNCTPEECMPEDVESQSDIPEEYAELAAYMLNEWHFNVPLITAWLERYYPNQAHVFVNDSGQLSAPKVLEALDYAKFWRLHDLHVAIKREYVLSIIRAFSQGEPWPSFASIQEGLAPFWPPRPIQDKHLGRIATMTLTGRHRQVRYTMTHT